MPPQTGDRGTLKPGQTPLNHLIRVQQGVRAAPVAAGIDFVCVSVIGASVVASNVEGVARGRTSRRSMRGLGAPRVLPRVDSCNGLEPRGCSLLSPIDPVQANKRKR